MRLISAPLVLLLLLLGTAGAAAEIRVTSSRMEDGRLIVTGNTSDTSRTVTLDGKFETRSNADGNFRFSVNYEPPTCMVDLRAGEDVYSAVVADCLPPRAADDVPVRDYEKAD